MIRFECTHCDQRCQVDEDQIGQRTRCPSCGEEQIVPRPWRTPQRRQPWRLPVALSLLVALMAGVWLTRPSSPAVTRARLATQLRSLSEHWKGTEWETCDPSRGDYKF